MLILNIGKGPDGYGSYAGTGIPGAIEISIDLLPSCNPDVVCDVLALPFIDEQFDRVIASHVLEHLDPYDINPALVEMKRVLKGTLHIRVPDMEWAYKEFLKNSYSLLLQRVIFGAKDGGYHRIGFDAGFLAAHVELAGLQLQSAKHDWCALATEYEDGRIEKENFREIRLDARRKDEGDCT